MGELQGFFFFGLLRFAMFYWDFKNSCNLVWSSRLTGYHDLRERCRRPLETQSQPEKEMEGGYNWWSKPTIGLYIHKNISTSFVKWSKTRREKQGYYWVKFVKSSMKRQKNETSRYAIMLEKSSPSPSHRYKKGIWVRMPVDIWTPSKQLYITCFNLFSWNYGKEGTSVERKYLDPPKYAGEEMDYQNHHKKQTTDLLEILA
jgi:hypothetical protein